MADGAEGGSAPVDPLRMFMSQRKDSSSNPVSPSGVSVKSAGANVPPATGSSQPPTPTSPHFDIESSLGSGISSRHQATVGGDLEHTPHARLECALAPGSNVDFPTITEICETLSARPDDVPGAVDILLNSLGPKSLPRRRLKALTILNELMYDDKVAYHVRRWRGALQFLQPLQACRGSGLGTEADGQIRMFATELDRRLFSQPEEPAPNPGAFKPAGTQLSGPRLAGPQAPVDGRVAGGPQAPVDGRVAGEAAADVFREGKQAMMTTTHSENLWD